MQAKGCLVEAKTLKVYFLFRETIIEEAPNNLYSVTNLAPTPQHPESPYLLTLLSLNALPPRHPGQHHPPLGRTLTVDWPSKISSANLLLPAG